MLVLQHRENPEYPGEWVEYPELSWVQPTFPTADTRYPLKPGKPLVLKFRIIVHSGANPNITKINKLWDEYHSEFAEPEFSLK
jgi:hypothetical protein